MSATNGHHNGDARADRGDDITSTGALEVGSEPWLRLFAATLRTVMVHNGFHRRTCILATHFGGEVLRYFGVRAVPEPVAICCFNEEAFRAVLDGSFDVRVHYTVGVRGTGSHTDGPVGTNTWDGHLVLRTLAAPRLVDLTADQFNRPDIDINIAGPLVTPSFDLGEWQREGTLTVFPDSGEAIRYDRLTDRGYRRSPDWKPRGARAREVIGSTISMLRDAANP